VAWLRGGASPAAIETFRAEARTRGAELQIGRIERGVLTDVLHQVRLTFGGAATIDVPEVRVAHRPLGPPRVRAERARVALHGDPLTAFSRVRSFVSAPLPGIDLGEVSVVYDHRSVGHWRLEGVRRGAAEGSFVAERARLGPQSWSNSVFSVAMKPRALELQWGSDTEAGPRAQAKYLAPDERAAEWIIVVPHQPLGAFGPENSSISGTLSWIVQSDPKLAPRGGVRFVLDQWDKPPWPEASALTGSSGSVAAMVLPTADGASFRLERVEVAAALFTLQGRGTFTSAAKPELRFTAKGQRTCSELAQHLAPSRYRDLIRAKLEQGVDPGWVELELDVQVTLGAGGGTRFRWRLAPGCGLAELTQ
jgi:hypothetical protein